MCLMAEADEMRDEQAAQNLQTCKLALNLEYPGHQIRIWGDFLKCFFDAHESQVTLKSLRVTQSASDK